MMAGYPNATPYHFGNPQPPNVPLANPLPRNAPPVIQANPPPRNVAPPGLANPPPRRPSLPWPNATLKVSYDVARGEIILQFGSPEYARKYQAKNPEGRIYADIPCDVWLPRDPMITAFYNSPGGMAFVFRNDQDRMRWQKRVLFAHIPAPTATDPFLHCLLFKHQWEERELKSILF
ncbi:hypothetical protein P280DRAFT_551812 [Massarina eburnea CBS 473.64]|uniref:Uncharacterized protein n=1 Tax=Massarina eburnea CBS 473.64 TaxID=1395130 RepID=A0A6A6RR98_9PLEO|nr:hypothetical protein P280DRAFT_551812 [Massarina eburnea CBS 473.64]